jgi:hypothetical protein
MLQKDIETFYSRGMHKVAALSSTVPPTGGSSSQVPLPPMIPEGIAPDLELVDLYEDVFKRPMNVREYILYINDLRANRGDTGYLETMYETQNAYYQNIKEIMYTYLDKYISEEQFLVHYLSKIHDEHYISFIRNEVIHSKEYAQKMTKKLQTIYRNMYGEAMSQDDVEYLFDRIKAREIGLNDDNLNEKVVQFRDENDDIIQRIFDVFFAVFDREPDTHEQDNAFKFIRQHISDEKTKVDELIAMDLKDSLEYHDVLKRKISKVYTKHSRDILFPSKMYHVLNKVLPMKHLQSIDAHIEQVVTEMLANGTGDE